MAILDSCCCFKTVRKGSFASAIFIMVYDVFVILVSGVVVNEEKNFLFGNETQPKSSTLLEPDTISTTTMVFNMTLLFVSVISFICCCILIYGLVKDYRVLLIPWMVMVSFRILIDVSHSLYLIALAARRLNPIHIVIFTFDFFLLMLTIYALLCVISQYQEYQAGRGRAVDYIQTYQDSNLPPPTSTSGLSTRKPCTYHETTATEPNSTMVSNDNGGVSPYQSARKSNLPAKHVQFGIIEAQRHPNGNHLTLW